MRADEFRGLEGGYGEEMGAGDTGAEGIRREGAATEEGPPSATEGDRAIRVLVAEDVEATAALLDVILRADPRFEVVATARTGNQAVALAERTRPDVIVLDLAMPGMRGPEALERIRADLPNVAVVVFTSYPEDIENDPHRIGAQHLVKKWEPIDNLLRAIADAGGLERESVGS